MKIHTLFVNDMPACGKPDYFLYVQDEGEPRAMVFSTQCWERMEKRIADEGCALADLCIELLTERLGVSSFGLDVLRLIRRKKF